MGVETETKREIPVISVDFVYDPAFYPDWYKKGEPVRGISPNTVREYLKIVNSQWEAYKRPISECIQEVLEVPTPFFWKKLTCYIADRQIRNGENNVLRAFTKPLSVSMIHPDLKWGFLPFFGDLVHELTHNFAYCNDAPWEILEDETAKEDFPNPSDFWTKPVKIRDEFVTRRATYKILTKSFGGEFADWFKSTESKEVLPL